LQALVLVTMVVAFVLALPTAGEAAVARAGDCPTAGTSAAGKPSCADCKASLKGSAFGDTNPVADDVGTTAGTEALLKAKLHKGCDLPKGARLVIIRQEIDFAGNDVGPTVRLKCPGDSCRITPNRSTAGGFRYQVAIVGCKNGKRSKVVTVVWAPKSTTHTPGPIPTPTPTPNPSGDVTMRLTQVRYFDMPVDPFCTAPLPAGAGLSSASYVGQSGILKAEWRWTIPAEIKGSATANTFVNASSTEKGGTSASIVLRGPSEFGIAPPGDQIEARVPVGQSGSDSNSKDYTFTPARNFVVGEKLSLFISHQCASYIYEYTGV
jgi:hypothetical protein